MKHLILNGGKPIERKAWVELLLRDAGREARIAFCMFAAPSEDLREKMLAGIQQQITKHAGVRQIAFRVLEADNFNEVSAWANIIVIPGGDPWQLKNALAQYGDLMELWDGKTVAGFSAGADVMVRRYMYLQDKVVQEGFGWLPVNLIPHWQADFEGWRADDWQWASRQLASGPGDVPLITIREGEFVEFAVQ
jgi:peptidase S51-like protein